MFTSKVGTTFVLVLLKRAPMLAAVAAFRCVLMICSPCASTNFFLVHSHAASTVQPGEIFCFGHTRGDRCFFDLQFLAGQLKCAIILTSPLLLSLPIDTFEMYVCKGMVSPWGPRIVHVCLTWSRSALLSHVKMRVLDALVPQPPPRYSISIDMTLRAQPTQAGNPMPNIKWLIQPLSPLSSLFPSTSDATRPRREEVLFSYEYA